MKINWGTGIVLALMAFISFILFFVLHMIFDDRANHDLVREDYYRAELGFQEEIDAQKSSQNNNVLLRAQEVPEGILLQFPEHLDLQEATGTVFLYRPSNKKLDFDLPLQLSRNQFLIPKDRLLYGRWNISVNWTHEGEQYLFKDKITYWKGKE